MTVQVSEIKHDNVLFEYCIIILTFEIVEISNGTKFVLKTNPLDKVLLKPNERISFEKFIPLYTKALKENIHLNHY